MAQKRTILKKKGIVDVQFNWIFVLIAGLVIFLFIISIVVSQKKNSDTQSAYSAAKQINSLIKSKQISGNVYSEVSMPRTEMLFSCDPDTLLFNFKISDSERLQLPTEIVFAPKSISTNKVEVWSQGFEMPFPVTTFLYMTTSDSAILIYSPDPANPGVAAGLLFDSIPGNMTKQKISDITQYSEFTKRKIVCFNNECPTHGDYIRIITGESGINGLNYGNVTYYKEANPSSVPVSTHPYIGLSSLYGAIFSDDGEYYSCQMSRAFNQFEVKRLLVENRLELLRTEPLTVQCNDSIGVALNDQVKSLANPSFNWENITYIHAKSVGLKSRNSQLLLGSCPTIY